jgi:hypothetical protein
MVGGEARKHLQASCRRMNVWCLGLRNGQGPTWDQGEKRGNDHGDGKAARGGSCSGEHRRRWRRSG